MEFGYKIQELAKRLKYQEEKIWKIFNFDHENDLLWLGISIEFNLEISPSVLKQMHLVMENRISRFIDIAIK